MTSPSSSEPHLIAVSVGKPREATWQGKPLQTGIFKAPVRGRVAAGALGLEGDGQADLAVHGGVDKAVYAYDALNTAYWRSQLGRPELGPGCFGENLTLSGLPEAQVFIGDRYRIGSACFEVSQPRQPCQKLAMRFEDAGFPKRFLESRRVGFYLRVVEPGEVGAGDAIVRIAHDPASLDVATLVSLFVARAPNEADLERAAGLAALADAWRIPLRERLEARRA
ncbi:MOSC domain-containing protein [Myxococcota bacterium]|nr:MOSC domain-containing protein [Myxococcota bacterium]